MKNLYVPVALVAGLVGGAFSHFVLSPVQAAIAAPKTVSAQSFTLVDASGKTLGIFTAEAQSRTTQKAPAIALFNAQGREIWRAGDTAQPIAASEQ